MTELEFTQVYKMTYPKVYRLCLGYMAGDEQTARELSQQTFIKVWNHRNSFKGESEISTWIYRIAVNCCLGYLKKKRPLQLQVDPKIEDESASDEENSTDDIQQLYRCIDQLKPINKTVILLELEQVPQEEIATTLGYSHGSIRTRLSRIREALLKCITHGK